MIRLSEALAKIECMDEVTVKHVKEAKRLLQKSIITVEQPDVDLEEGTNDTNLGMDVDEPSPLMAAFNAGGNDGAPPSTRMSAKFFYCLHNSFILMITFMYCLASNEISHEPPKKKLTMSFEEYKNLSNMLVLYMRSEESRVESEGIFITILTIEIRTTVTFYYIYIC